MVRVGIVNLKKRFLGDIEILRTYIGNTIVYESITQYVIEFTNRILKNKGYIEGEVNLRNRLDILRDNDLIEELSLFFTPNSTKESKSYSIIPTSIFSPELVKDPTFSTPSNWNIGSGISISENTLKVINPVENVNFSPKTPINLVSSKTYEIKMDITKTSIGGNLLIEVGGYIYHNINTGTIYLQPDVNTNFIIKIFQQWSGVIENISVKEFAGGDLKHVRNSLATTFDKNGQIKLAPKNLFSYSNYLNNNLWVKENLSVTSTLVVNPVNGVKDVFSIASSTSATNVSFKVSQDVNGHEGVLSFYVKVREVNRIIVRHEINGVLSNMVFNLSTQVVSNNISGANGYITTESDGWLRCIILYTEKTNNSNTIHISDNDSIVATLPIGTGLYIYGLQFEQNIHVTDYLDVLDRVNIGRINYLSGLKSMLLEPKRINILKYSCDFLNPFWNKQGGTAFLSSVLSPNNIKNANKLLSTSTICYVSTSISALSVTSTLSVFVKYGNADYVIMSFDGIEPVKSVFNVKIGTFGIMTTSVIDRTIVDYGNGFFRITLTAAPNSGNPLSEVRLQLSSDDSFNGSCLIDTYSIIFGAQLEKGYYATSLMPSIDTSFTRNMDSFLRDNIFNNGVVSTSGGTWYIELVSNLPYVRDNTSTGLFLDTDLVLTNGFNLSNNGTGRLKINKNISGNTTELCDTLTENPKIIIRWNGSTADVFVNGAKVVTDTPFSFTQMQNMNCNNEDTPKEIAAIYMFRIPIMDEQCVFLTT